MKESSLLSSKGSLCASHRAEVVHILHLVCVAALKGWRRFPCFAQEEEAGAQAGEDPCKPLTQGLHYSICGILG